MIRLFAHLTIYSAAFCPERVFQVERHPEKVAERPEFV
jgi:hypothetical protein